ncbi:MAG: hypothetical protein JXK05_10475 [Campylobacterales bacterium]|nr:hypothetical protein [Campylobacterales bacterium]
MIYLIAALPAETRPFIDLLKATLSDVLPFGLYTHDTALIAVTGSGHDNALIATSALLGHRPPQANDVLVNVGIAAAPQAYAIGTLMIAHKLTCKGQHDYYPDMLLRHAWEECSLESVLEPQCTPLSHPCDMEAHAVFKTASRFMGVHQMLFAKVVSDHFEPQRVSKEEATVMIGAHAQALLEYADNLERFITPKALFSAEEQAAIAQLKRGFTKTQSHKLDDALHRYRLRGGGALPKLCFEPLHVTHKKERGARFDAIIRAL